MGRWLKEWWLELSLVTTVAVILFVVLWLSIGSNRGPVNDPTMENGRFVIKHDERTISIYEDTLTGERYLFVKVGSGGGLSRMPRADD